MNRFLFGALAMGAVFVLTSFALTRNPAPLGGPAWTVSQYQLDRAFRTNVQPGLSATVPPTQGAIITEVRVPSVYGTFSLTVNGFVETFERTSNGWGAQDGDFHLNPPIILRPGDSFSTAGPQSFLIAGYTTLPGET